MITAALAIPLYDRYEECCVEPRTGRLCIVRHKGPAAACASLVSWEADMQPTDSPQQHGLLFRLHRNPSARWCAPLRRTVIRPRK